MANPAELVQIDIAAQQAQANQPPAPRALSENAQEMLRIQRACSEEELEQILVLEDLTELREAEQRRLDAIEYNRHTAVLNAEQLRESIELADAAARRKLEEDNQLIALLKQTEQEAEMDAKLAADAVAAGVSLAVWKQVLSDSMQAAAKPAGAANALSAAEQAEVDFKRALAESQASLSEDERELQRAIRLSQRLFSESFLPPLEGPGSGNIHQRPLSADWMRAPRIGAAANAVHAAGLASVSSPASATSSSSASSSAQPQRPAAEVSQPVMVPYFNVQASAAKLDTIESRLKAIAGFTLEVRDLGKGMLGNAIEQVQGSQAPATSYLAALNKCKPSTKNTKAYKALVAALTTVEQSENAGQAPRHASRGAQAAAS